MAFQVTGAGAGGIERSGKQARRASWETVMVCCDAGTEGVAGLRIEIWTAGLDAIVWTVPLPLVTTSFVPSV